MEAETGYFRTPNLSQSITRDSKLCDGSQSILLKLLDLSLFSCLVDESDKLWKWKLVISGLQIWVNQWLTTQNLSQGVSQFYWNYWIWVSSVVLLMNQANCGGGSWLLPFSALLVIAKLAACMTPSTCNADKNQHLCNFWAGWTGLEGRGCCWPQGSQMMASSR